MIAGALRQLVLGSLIIAATACGADRDPDLGLVTSSGSVPSASATVDDLSICATE